MHVGVLTNIFDSSSEVENDLMEFGQSVKKALQESGHKATLFDIKDTIFENLKNSKIDIAFNVCERINGNAMLEPHVASALEVLNIPFTGSSSFALALCIHKSKVRDILKANGVPMPDYQVFHEFAESDFQMKFPVICKPECTDNSIGISNNAVAKNINELKNNISYITEKLGQPAIVEEFVSGREFGVGIMGNEEPAILPISEVKYSNDLLPEEKLLSYSAKWHPNTDIYKLTPYVYNVNLPSPLMEKMEHITKKCYKLLHIRDYGTVEFRLDKNNEPKVIEVNPNPGLSSHSIIPQIFENSGKSYAELANAILEHASKRHGMADGLH